MRFFLCPILIYLFAFSAKAQNLAGNGINDLCDPPVITSATICAGNDVTCYVQNPDATYAYNWYADAAHNILLGTGSSFTTPVLFETTSYYVVAVQGACSAETVKTVTVNSLVPPVMKNDTNCDFLIHPDICHPSVGNPQPGYDYYWYEASIGGVSFYTGITYTTPYLLTNTNYYVEAHNGGCVSQRVVVHAVISEMGGPPIAYSVTICQGTTATLAVEDPYSGYAYHWYSSPTDESPLHTGTVFTTAVLNSPITYYVNATRQDCYTSRVPVTVNIHISPAPVANDVSICPGTSALLSVQNPDPGFIYSWYASPVNGVVLGTGVHYTSGLIFTPTTFFVGVNDGVCDGIGTLTPVAVKFPSLDSPVVAVLHADFNNVTFGWQPVTGAVGYEVSINGSPYVSPSSGNTGLTHTVSGLQNAQTITIKVKAIPSPQFCGNESYGHATGQTYGIGFYVPSAFTPNGDTRNDLLKPIIPFGSVLEYFTVYDRWGKQVFTTNKNGIGWDGKCQGKEQPVGTYVWMCSYLFAGKTEIFQKGSFIIIR